MSYNGWENYETWCVNLWLRNDEFTDLLCSKIVENAKSEVPEGAIYVAAARIRDYVESGVPDNMLTGMYGDLLLNALRSVEWVDIAKSFEE